MKIFEQFKIQMGDNYMKKVKLLAETKDVQAVNDTSERDEAAVAIGSINSKATEKVTVQVECNSNGNELEYTEAKCNELRTKAVEHEQEIE